MQALGSNEMPAGMALSEVGGEVGVLESEGGAADVVGRPGHRPRPRHLPAAHRKQLALGLLAVTIVCSTGVGLAYGAMPALIMGAVPQSETASANSFNTLMRSIGSSVSAAVMAVVLARIATKFGPVSLPSESGFRVAMLIGSCVGIAAAVVAFLIPVRPTAARPQAEPTQDAASEAVEAKA